ncbi:hypothetical protein CDAR_559971 [Caerostris darwini]|uniref:Uncharacterized protein n=1 Tax=Caerostris darwini TaxID=1538125 RepID=A0AAV4VGQ9_9ARAC|nr:hypothetical protein CDAR_559971 [Caerostris darwini]
MKVKIEYSYYRNFTEDKGLSNVLTAITSITQVATAVQSSDTSSARHSTSLKNVSRLALLKTLTALIVVYKDISSHGDCKSLQSSSIHPNTPPEDWQLRREPILHLC